MLVWVHFEPTQSCPMRSWCESPRVIWSKEGLFGVGNPGGFGIENCASHYLSCQKGAFRRDTFAQTFAQVSTVWKVLYFGPLCVTCNFISLWPIKNNTKRGALVTALSLSNYPSTSQSWPLLYPTWECPAVKLCVLYFYFSVVSFIGKSMQ